MYVYMSVYISASVWMYIIKRVNFGYVHMFYTVHISNLWTPKGWHLFIICLDITFNIHYNVFSKLETQKIFIDISVPKTLYSDYNSFQITWLHI